VPASTSTGSFPLTTQTRILKPWAARPSSFSLLRCSCRRRLLSAQSRPSDLTAHSEAKVHQRRLAARQQSAVQREGGGPSSCSPLGWNQRGGSSFQVQRQGRVHCPSARGHADGASCLSCSKTRATVDADGNEVSLADWRLPARPVHQELEIPPGRPHPPLSTWCTNNPSGWSEPVFVLPSLSVKHWIVEQSPQPLRRPSPSGACIILYLL